MGHHLAARSSRSRTTQLQPLQPARRFHILVTRIDCEEALLPPLLAREKMKRTTNGEQQDDRRRASLQEEPKVSGVAQGLFSHGRPSVVADEDPDLPRRRQ